MVALSNRERFTIWQEFMSGESNKREPITVDKRNLRNIIDNLDVHIDTILARLNVSSIPNFSSLSRMQRLQLVSATIQRRLEIM